MVDGAHRLSALIAWVHDDYGAGKLSANLYQNVIPEQQRIMHETTRSLVNSRIGSYQDHQLASKYPDAAAPEVLSRASSFPFRNIDIQWIRNAGVEQARDAFFRINQGGTTINDTEKRILRARDSALAISTRAITRGGTGHAYWQKFEPEIKRKIEALGAEIHKLLFQPQLKLPIKTTDVPVAGFAYGDHVLPFVFDLVALTNRLTISDSTRKRADDKDIPDDSDGAETIRYLSRTKRVVHLICSTDPSSLGLHPALYFYTAAGAFQSASFFNTTSWFMDLEAKCKLNQFLIIRQAFESLILEHPVIVKPAAHKLGSGVRTRARMIALYVRIFDLLSNGNAPGAVWTQITSEEDFQYLVPDDHEQRLEAQRGGPGLRFDRKAKSAGFFEQFLPQVAKCPLCGGLLHANGMVSDHKLERAKGGSSATANVQLVHPICTSNRETSE